MAAVTEYLRQGGLNNIYFPQLWRLEVQDQGASMISFLQKLGQAFGHQIKCFSIFWAFPPFFFFFASPAARVSSQARHRPCIAPAPQQCWILNPLCHKGTFSSPFEIFFFLIAPHLPTIEFQYHRYTVCLFMYCGLLEGHKLL